jgi:hypothetical protein
MTTNPGKLQGPWHWVWFHLQPPTPPGTPPLGTRALSPRPSCWRSSAPRWRTWRRSPPQGGAGARPAAPDGRRGLRGGGGGGWWGRRPPSSTGTSPSPQAGRGLRPQPVAGRFLMHFVIVHQTLREPFHRKKNKKVDNSPLRGGGGPRKCCHSPLFFFFFFLVKKGVIFFSFKKGKSMYLLPFNNLLSKMVWNRAKCPFLYFISLWKPSPIAREL